MMAARGVQTLVNNDGEVINLTCFCVEHYVHIGV